jgi:hypothetical protein
MKKWFISLPWSGIGLIIIAMLILTALIIRISVMASESAQNNSDGGNSASQSLVDPTPSPSLINEEIPYDPLPTCEGVLGGEYSALESRILNYEKLFQSSRSQERSIAIQPLTTAKYQQEHEDIQPYTESDFIVELLSSADDVNCTPNQDGSSLLVTVLITIKTSTAKGKVIYDSLTLPRPHASTWVQETGEWKVEEEYDQ